MNNYYSVYNCVLISFLELFTVVCKASISSTELSAHIGYFVCVAINDADISVCIL